MSKILTTDIVTVADQAQLIEAPGAHQATPTLALGDGDTGFWESADDVLNVGTGNLLRQQFGTGYVQMANLTGVGARFVIQDHTFEAASVISPAALGGDVTDYAPAGITAPSYATVLRMNLGGAARIMNSLAGGTAGRMLWIVNTSTTPGEVLTLLMDNGATGTAAMRFFCPNGVSFIVPIYGTVLVMYDAVSSRWRVCGPVA